MFLTEAFAEGGLPIQASTIAGRWDLLYHFLVWLSVFFFLLVMGGMIYYAIQYRHTKGHKTKYVTGSHALEGIFVAGPTILLLVIFAWGWKVYHDMTSAPHDAYEIRVIGKQWSWDFQYDTGKVTTGELYVPLNKPVKLVMTSQDVLHSFFVPSFRVKQDVVPGMYTSLWFEATVPGKHQVFCAEYCGAAHSGMLAQVIVLDEDQWRDWTAGKQVAGIGGDATPTSAAAAPRAEGKQGEAPAEGTGAGRGDLMAQGMKLAQTKGCVACHSTDGTTKIGPSWKGSFGAKRELVDGSSVTVDDNYLRESIEAPAAKVVKGFTPTMPPFKGLLTEEELGAMITYIKSLK